MLLEKNFLLIKNYFEKKDRKKVIKKSLVHNTDYGIWGASSLIDLFALFKKIRLERFKSFADYGSGDGRVVILASLFTKATGIEGNKELFEESLKAKNDLEKEIQEIKKTDFINKNYFEENHSKYDILFSFFDHDMPLSFEEELKNNFKGLFLSYYNVFGFKRIKKGRTIWINQTPIITYPININEKNLF